MQTIDRPIASWIGAVPHRPGGNVPERFDVFRFGFPAGAEVGALVRGV